MIAWLRSRLPLTSRQFIKFGMVGTSGMVVDLGLLVLLVEVVRVPVLVANNVAFLAAVASNYVWNRRWTFRSTHPKIARQFGSFLLVSLVGLIVNVAGMKLLLSLGIWYVLAKLVLIALVVIWNFLANRAWTFAAGSVDEPVVRP